VSHYIKLTEITDEIILSFISRGDNLERYFDKVSGAFNDFAYSNGVTSTSLIDVDADDGTLENYTCREWCIAWVGYNVCKDNVGKVGREVDPSTDKYRLKAEDFKADLNEAAQKITYTTITGQESQRSDLVSSAYLIRG